MLRVPLNDLRRAVMDRDGLDIAAAVQRVISSGWYVHGPEHDAFESEFADFLGVAHCIAVGNGTSALELALTTVRAEGRDVVIGAANAGGYTSVAAARCGLRMRFADVLPETLCLDPAEVARLLTPDVAAVVVTHLYGRLGPVRELQSLCAAAGVVLIEDCAQAVGATYENTKAGAFGDIATFSFYPTKNLGALGDGGAVVTHDSARAALLRSLRQYGWEQKYHVQRPEGQNSRLDEMQAAVLRVRLPGLHERNARRRSIISRYVEAASSSVRVLPADREDHVAHLAVLLCDDRRRVQAHLTKAGVSSDIHYPVPDHLQPGLRSGGKAWSLPVTEQLCDEVLSVPCFPELRDDEIGLVCDALASL